MGDKVSDKVSDKKYTENDPERTLITLDQLSQTIEVMTSVVNRLRQHLSEQVLAKKEIEELERAQKEARKNAGDDDENRVSADKLFPTRKRKLGQPGVVVEVSKPDSDQEEALDDKTLH